MALEFDPSTRDAMLDAIDTHCGATATLILYALNGGTYPATCDTAMPGPAVKVAVINLPNTPFAAASGGVMTKAAGAWEDTSADNGGTIDFFRIFRANQGTNATDCVMQGSAGTSGTDLILDNNVVTATQTVTVTAFTLTAGNTDA